MSIEKDVISHVPDLGDEEQGPVKDYAGVILTGQVHTLSSEDRAAALRYAQQIDPGPRAFSFRALMFVWIGLTACMCGGDNGEIIACSLP